MRANIEKGALTVGAMRAGYHAALTQAEQLLEEARVLRGSNKHAGAYQRLVIALEELGKARLFAVHGPFVVSCENPGWSTFWRAYRSHFEKLRQAHIYYDIDSIVDAETKTAVSEAFQRCEATSRRLDRAKQESTYSDFIDGEFRSPDGNAFSSDCDALVNVVERVLERLRASRLANCADDQCFGDELGRMFRYANGSGYLKTEPDELNRRIAAPNQDLYTLDCGMPGDAEFMERVESRYRELPPKIAVTLGALRRSPKFRKFYEAMKVTRGYPDWMILGVVFNIALNSRVDVARFVRTGCEFELLDWSEDERVDRPLPTSLFIDEERFERHLDQWLLAFLAGLGVGLSDPGENACHARAVAVRLFDILNRDVEHQPLLLPRARRAPK